MERSLVILIVLGVAATAGLIFVSPYLSMIAVVITAIAAMAIWIGRDAEDLPDIEIKLADDARAVRLRNTGNAPALRVHTSVVPINFDFDVASIAVDAVHEQPLPAQVSEVKAVVSFENARGEPFKRSQLLSALHADSDPLRPTFPIFGWR
ncbi:MAG: hypothetical protein GXY82_11350 [Methanospirillum sp.]|nr:hypothetical protein [Methanospirillum sp.]